TKEPPSYVTNRLERLDAVEVVEGVEPRPDGWLVIRPPAHSTSWINTRFLGAELDTTRNRVVNHKENPVPVPVFPAHADGNVGVEGPRALGVRLQTGYQVTTTG